MISSISLSSIQEAESLHIIDLIRKGIPFKSFNDFVIKGPFSLPEWSKYLHISDRTMQRYQKESKAFELPQSEKIVELALFYERGIKVFGDKSRFDAWLSLENIALHNTRPKDLLDSTMGINWLHEVLTRIEHGVFA
ncbi:MAG: DUF2384 domain-containing protein [Saprospiraceae bacterium]|nr:DUF2384 domain-containing protein [Saprospiraceae bacterium]